MKLIAQTFLLGEVPPGLLLNSGHEPWLVAMSILVAIITSYVALSLSDRARVAPTAQLRLGALATGALSLGGGVWTMHFIGMLAFRFCSRVDYDPWWTLGSIAPSLGASWVALRGLSHQHVSARRLMQNGLMMGSGIGLMHYGGMAAVRSTALLRYDPTWFAASIIVAVALSTIALWLHLRLRQQLAMDWRVRTLLAAVILGGAISGMHYTAMAAARFIGVADVDGMVLSPMYVQLAMGVALIALVVSFAAVGFNAVMVQRQLTRERLRSEARLQALVDTAVDGVVRMDDRGTIVAANRAAETIFGLPVSGLAGQALARFVPTLAGPLGDVDGVIESTAHHADGHELKLRLAIGRSDQDGVIQRVAFVSDITDIRRRQAELEGVQTAIRRALVVVEFDLGGHVLRANDAFLALTGHTADTLIGQHHRMLCLGAEADSAEYAEHWAALRRGEFRTGDFVRLRRDGQRIWIRATYNPLLDADGQPTRIVKFVNDLTERHVLEQDLRQAKGRAEQAAAAKSTFLANMSHEIRTPMNAIIGFSEVALDGELNSDARGHLQIIQRSARSLLSLLNDILDTAKLEQGAVELEQRDFSLRQLCEDVLATLTLGAERKGLRLALQIDAAVPAFHHGDPLRLRQILLNLVGNAVKFTERGSVTLTGLQLNPGLLELAVQDTGIGIAADRLEHIFDPFAQADATMTRRFGGTGLGTTIARQLVRLMGGEIGVVSTLGKGSRFWLRLPLAAGQAPQADTAHTAMTALPPLRILVADDVPENLRLLELRLGALGHQLVLARDGQEALEQMQAGGIDIALLDVQMPRLDGLQACRLLRAHEAEHHHPRLPVIALTASASDDDRSLTEGAGMDGFVVKPIDWPVLLAEMARLLGLTLEASASAVLPAAAPPEAALPEAVEWPQALAGWGDVLPWQEQLHRFLSTTLRQWPGLVQDGALAHRLRGGCANFGLSDLAATCAVLEGARAHDGMAWHSLHSRLQGLQQALLERLPAADGRLSDEPWPSEATAALMDALTRGELPEAAYRNVMQALPGQHRQRLRDALDDFDFDEARALLADYVQEMA